MEAASRVIERERERIKKRLAPHYRNTVWEKERQNDLTLQVEFLRILVMSLTVLINGHLLENSSLLKQPPISRVPMPFFRIGPHSEQQ